MLEKDEFEIWIGASHKLFELFEGRHDAYPLAKKWVQQSAHPILVLGKYH